MVFCPFLSESTTVYLDFMAGDQTLNNIPSLRERRSLIAPLWHFYGVLKMAGWFQ